MHKWNKEERELIAVNRDLTASSIKARIFFNRRDISVAGIQRQKDYIVGKIEHGSNAIRPWSKDDIMYMIENYRKTNEELAKKLNRIPFDLNKMRYAVKHNKLTNAQKRLVFGNIDISLENGSMEIKKSPTAIIGKGRRCFLFFIHHPDELGRSGIDEGQLYFVFANTQEEARLFIAKEFTYDTAKEMSEVLTYSKSQCTWRNIEGTFATDLAKHLIEGKY